MPSPARAQALRASAVRAFFSALLLGACTPELRDNHYGCPDGVCPEGFSCVAERCVRAASLECFSDANCTDDDPCVEVHCVSGRCERTPVENGCDDGDFCNGADVCVEGACVNPDGAMPPCDSCDPTATPPCADCGQIGAMCCGGESCAEGVCIGGMCRGCGALDEPCCIGDRCDDLHTICEEGSCGSCGRMGEVCCQGFGNECRAGLTCTEEKTCLPPVGCADGCPAGETCVDGSCQRCGIDGAFCCDGTRCDPGFGCDLTTRRCGPCGANGQVCCLTLPPCAEGLACDSMRHCSPCGRMEGSPCCRGPAAMECAAGLICDEADSCAPCGGSMQRCCPGIGGGATGCHSLTAACAGGFCFEGCGGVGEVCCSAGRCMFGTACVDGTCR